MASVLNTSDSIQRESERQAAQCAKGEKATRGVMSQTEDPAGGRLPRLTRNERAYLVEKARESLTALVDHAHTLDGPVQWHYTGKFNGIQMYRGEGTIEGNLPVGTEFLCGVTTMAGTIEEVSSYFDQATTARMKTKMADDMIDCAVLYSLVNGEPTNPFHRVSVKYSSFEGPARFSRARDYCYIEVRACLHCRIACV